MRRVQTSRSESGVTCGETSFNKISMGTMMTIGASGLLLAQTLLRTAPTSGQDFISKDRDSDGRNTTPVAFLFRFYGCKLLNLLYLFLSPDSVDLKETSA